MADTTLVPEEKQTVVGPDGKKYLFKKSTNTDKINNYFIKKGWVLKEGKWFTANGEPAKELQHVGSPLPNTAKNITEKRQQLDKMGKLSTDVALYGTAAMPSILGAVGGMLRGVPGAAIGGGLGEGIRDFTRQTIMDQEVKPSEYIKDIVTGGVKQGVLEKVGQKTGEIFFNQLNKLPHAVVKKGIPLLPGDVNPNSKLMKYVEDLLTNLAPSAKTMANFREKQNEAIVKQVEKLANGFAKFDGTSEEMGILLQNTMRKADDMAQINLEAIRKSLPKSKQTLAELKKTQAYKDYIDTFDYELMRHVLKTNKPELIAGFLRTKSASLNETRLLTDYTHELNPELLGKVKNRILRDVLQETITGSKDPTLKGIVSKSFSGVKFKQILDGIGEERLKVLFGENGYSNINKFEELIAHVDKTQGNGIGRFINLMFLLPFRSGTSLKGVGKTFGMGVLFNRAAKIITNPQGIKLYENFIKATSQQTPRLANLARDEMIAFNEKSDKEYELEQQIAEEEYKKSMPEVKSLSFGTDEWERTVLNK